LRAVAFLADNSPDACTTDQISVATKVPKPYLSKVLQNLSRCKIVRSQRGIGGGVTLVKPPKDLSLLEVVDAVEPIERIAKCPLGIAEHGEHLCPLHRRMDDALAMVQNSFQRTTLDELLLNPNSNHPLCEVVVEPKQPEIKSASNESVASRELKSIESNPCFNAIRPCDTQ
jgi:Rrf2 family protein